MNKNDLGAYRKYIQETYDERSGAFDRSEWHQKTALRLIEELPPRSGDSVLDIGTGTGTIAFHAAPLVGPNGNIIGVDLSKAMLAEANKKLAASGLENIAFVLADAERLGFSDNSFDRIYCASMFFCILDPLATLRRWFDFLKPDGGLGLHALPETSYFWVSVARDVLASYGFPYLLNTSTGTIDKTRHLLSRAGFRDIDIREQSAGYYVPLEKAKQTWIQRDDFAPGQYPHPIQNVPSEIVAPCRRDYERRIEELNTDKGVWNDVSMYYVYARK